MHQKWTNPYIETDTGTISSISYRFPTTIAVSSASFSVTVLTLLIVVGKPYSLDTVYPETECRDGGECSTTPSLRHSDICKCPAKPTESSLKHVNNFQQLSSPSTIVVACPSNCYPAKGLQNWLQAPIYFVGGSKGGRTPHPPPQTGGTDILLSRTQYGCQMNYTNME